MLQKLKKTLKGRKEDIKKIHVRRERENFHQPFQRQVRRVVLLNVHHSLADHGNLDQNGAEQERQSYRALSVPP